MYAYPRRRKDGPIVALSEQRAHRDAEGVGGTPSWSRPPCAMIIPQPNITPPTSTPEILPCWATWRASETSIQPSATKACVPTSAAANEEPDCATRPRRERIRPPRRAGRSGCAGRRIRRGHRPGGRRAMTAGLPPHIDECRQHEPPPCSLEVCQSLARHGRAI